MRTFHQRICPFLASTSRNTSRGTHTVANQLSAPHVVVLGGGITGLSAAYHLSRWSKHTRVTLLEASPRLGGWIDSKRVNLESCGGSSSFILESGPRTLRSNSKAVLELINLLQLDSELITVPKTSPAAQKRFLYIAGSSNGLTTLPTLASISSFWKSPVGPKIVSAVLNEYWTTPNRPADTDESVDSFMSRRFGREMARIFASSMTHGIYAADSRRLSVRTAFPSLWDAESRGGGSVVWGLLKRKSALQEEKYETGNSLQRLMDQALVFSFKHGLSTLIDGLVREMRKDENVNIRVADGVASIDLCDPFIVRTSSGNVLTPTHIISALPMKHLRSVLGSSQSASSQPLKSILSSRIPPASSVYVTDLIFPPTQKLIHPSGFGYLIPRPPGGYSNTSALKAENGLGILGVMFGSTSLREQDSTKGYTKMTVISGGPYMSSHSAPPDVGAILKSVRGHLGAEYEVPEPVYANVTECRECIPLYEVGHLNWVRELKGSLRPFGQRLHIIGAGVGGVSIPDCVKQGREVARDIVASY